MTASNPPIETRVLPYDEGAIAEAAELILAGQLVAAPTETVYGLAGDATNAAAIARIYAAKGRPSFNPLIVHVRDVDEARRLAEFEGTATRLAERFWPGPLTLVLPQREGSTVATITTAGLPTIALRVPAHPAMQSLLTASGRPLAAPSANASGSISPTRAEHVLKSLGGRIPLIIDAGRTAVGVESTIVSVKGGVVTLLRQGPVSAEAIESVTDAPLAIHDGNSIEAPGMLERHYAPSKPLRLDATTAKPGEYMIGFGTAGGDVSLSESADLVEAAARLFDLLHQADESGAASIAVRPIPNESLGVAINDRLRRAAHR